MSPLVCLCVFGVECMLGVYERFGYVHCGELYVCLMYVLCGVCVLNVCIEWCVSVKSVQSGVCLEFVW